jgi:hypothetical protein
MLIKKSGLRVLMTSKLFDSLMSVVQDDAMKLRFSRPLLNVLNEPSLALDYLEDPTI